MMIIKGIKTCWWLIISDKTYFRYVCLLVLNI